MTHTVTLTDQEVVIIQSALTVISPTGGGSPPFNLYRKLCHETEISYDDDMLRTFCSTVISEYEQSKD